MSGVTKSYTVGPIEIHFPDAADPDFSFTHDLAELFGLQTNTEAVRRLRSALTSRAKLSIDNEADYVFVSTRNVEAMLVALRGVRAASARLDLFDDASVADPKSHGVRSRIAYDDSGAGNTEFPADQSEAVFEPALGAYPLA